MILKRQNESLLIFCCSILFTVNEENPHRKVPFQFSFWSFPTLKTESGHKGLIYRIPSQPLWGTNRDVAYKSTSLENVRVVHFLSFRMYELSWIYCFRNVPFNVNRQVTLSNLLLKELESALELAFHIWILLIGFSPLLPLSVSFLTCKGITQLKH